MDAPSDAAIDTLLERHGLQGAPRTRYDSGSLPVYALGADHVLKLFPPHEGDHASIEARTLQALQGRLPIPTPRLMAHGRFDGGHYLLMSQLRGRRLVDAWPALAADAKDRLAERLGEALAALHSIDTTPLADFTPSWQAFIAEQRASAAQRQRARGLDALWVEQVEPFLERWMPAPVPRLALLHTEVMREHLMVDGAGTLTGLFDFEPAMPGAPEYEFSSFGLFVACGDARLLRRTLRAYGYADSALDTALQRRLMAYTLLHRYSNLSWYLERLPVPGATSLEQLAAHWWAL